MNQTKLFAAFVVAPLAFVSFSLAAEGYRVPDQAIINLVDAPVTPGVSISPDGSRLLLMARPAVPTIEDMSAPELRLAGFRINPDTQGPSKPNYFTSLALMPSQGGEAVTIRDLPRDARIRNVSWSPDGQFIAFTNDTSRIQLWVVDVRRGRARQIYRGAILDTFPGNPITWHPNSRELLATVPHFRHDAPVRSAVPTGPVVQENLGRQAPGRTFQDLLQDTHDEALFDHHFTAEIHRFTVTGGGSRAVGPGLYTSVSYSPDGNWILTQRLQRPYSYLVPAFRFPQVTEVSGYGMGRPHVVVESCPLADQIPIGFDAVSACKRSITWRNDAPATLVWAQAADGGDPRQEAEVRDRVFAMDAPFQNQVELAALGLRYRGIQWGDGDFAMVYDGWWNTRQMRAWRIRPDAPGEQVLLMDRSTEDRYNDPGTPVTRTNAAGYPVLARMDDGRLMMFGNGASPEGDRPFVDLWNPDSGENERLWRSEAPHYEAPAAWMGGMEILTTREAVNDPPNFYRRHLGSGELTALTAFEHPTPELVGVQKEMIRYERNDGLPLSGTLYLPPGYDRERDGRLPLVVWAYPREFVSLDAAGQVQDSPYRFTRLSYWRPQFLVTQGYAVLDDATMPIVGFDGVEPNDTFIEQVVANGQAAVDAVVEMGVADRDRAAIGGHSYGAFMTANIMAHSDIFRAGVARSGAYNRSLTPFGFQREQRTVWDDTDLYIRMSPFFHAHNIKRPLLLIHGAEDNNSGTFPIQSERLYQAIRGHGGTVRLVMLPNESHGYRARESLLHMLWETTTWLDTWVKSAE